MASEFFSISDFSINCSLLGLVSRFAPWKSSLSSAYKPTTSSAYSSRDDISSTRYSSLATPSTYRPSFAGGTYRIKREPPPVPVTTYTSRYAAVNSTTSSGTGRSEKENTNDGSSKIGQIKRYTTTTSNLGKYGSREASPAALERTNRIKSREPSPVSRSIRGKSRDPSPVIDTKCKIGYNGVNTYRMSTPRSTASTYTSRYGAGTNTRTSNVLPDKSISYLSVSDFRARSISRAKEIALRKSSEKEIEEATATQVEEDIIEPIAAEQKDDNLESEELSEEETFVNVSVVTRATSPTPPGSTTVQRTRRIDIAKTIEKTIQRSTKKKKMLEKEIQSDRLDDSTRYSRFGISSRVSSYSPHSESRYSSNLRYSASPLSSASKSTSSSNENKKDDASSSNSNKTNRTTSSKSKLSPSKVVRINSRQSSVENLSASNAKPPAAPKAESPSKTSTSSSSAVVKWPNKDFRKSALNVGPTDRPRKSRTPSTGTDSDAMPANTCEIKSTSNANNNQRGERASSVGSECSNASATSNGKRTTNSGDGKVRQRCHVKVSNNTTTSTLSRNNSSTSLKNASHKSCTPTTAVSSSSGTESSSENRKTNKKSTKKKATNTHNKTVENAKFRGDNNAGDVNDLSPKHSTKFENSKTSQPPATKSAATNQTDSSAQRAEESTSTATTTASDYRLQKLSNVSNFFVNCQNDANSEPIFVESSESSSDLNTDQLNEQNNVSLTEDFETKTNSQAYISPTSKATKTNSDPARKAASSNSNSNSIRYSNTNTKSAEDSFVYNPPCSLRSKNSLSTHSSEARTESSSYTQRTAATESELQPNTEQDESSWWQDTSRQIDTTSALDYNYKDEMHFKLRHIDSGETAWWLRNDEDDTLADDNIKTFNNEDDADDVTDAVPSLPSNSNSGAHNQTKQNWWTSETDDEHDPDISRCRSAEAHYEPSSAAIESWESRQYQMPKSHCTPEKQWWSESSNSKNTASNNTSKQNGAIQLKICRIESGERPWWLDEESGNNNDNEGVIEDNTTVEATIKLPKKSNNKSSSNSKSVEPSEDGSNNANKSEQEHRWWMSAPTKKLLNIKRVESGEKAWWQQEDTESNNNADIEVTHTQTKFSPMKRNDSCEKDWWLESNNDIPSNGKQNGQLQIRESDDDSDGEVNQNGGDIEVQNINTYNGNDEIGRYIDSNAELSNSFNFEYSERPPPLGQCASPVGHEENTTNMRLCKSPYDNIPMSTVQSKSLQQQQQQQQQVYQQQQSTNTNPYCYFNNSNNNGHSNAKQAQQLQQQQQRELFISRHQSIDELLGGSCRPLSPLFFDGNSFSTLPTNRNMFLEKITPDQVIIHDSTAQMPIIQRMERDEWDNCNGATNGRPTLGAPQIPYE
ncbi:probable WRKY transcription factor protein 1 [Teleopsis dalmanni]|uniref:probable WRKY transcription factor protein 1 n=1 Tax=Teleopsis dalmanni TaxID=139649 RepID=UPI0018CCC6A5|nr:probable WRKY transcription factor protein 1 [Teleopsis dalmanni]